MTSHLVPTRYQFEQRVPESYRTHAGIGPYYLPIFGRMYTQRLRDCLDAIRRNAHHPQSILDVGCGLGLATGAVADMYPDAEVFGLDVYSDDVLRHARDLTPGGSRVTFISGSVQKAPFPDQRFDVISALDVLEHVDRPDVALDEIRRMLARRGIAVISVPIESPILRGLRYIALAGGRRGDIEPHWNGTLHGLPQFERAWRDRFEPLEVRKTPLQFAPRIVNYGVILIGRSRS